MEVPGYRLTAASVRWKASHSWMIQAAGKFRRPPTAAIASNVSRNSTSLATSAASSGAGPRFSRAPLCPALTWPAAGIVLLFVTGSGDAAPRDVGSNGPISPAHAMSGTASVRGGAFRLPVGLPPTAPRGKHSVPSARRHHVPAFLVRVPALAGGNLA